MVSLGILSCNKLQIVPQSSNCQDSGVPLLISFLAFFPIKDERYFGDNPRPGPDESRQRFKKKIYKTEDYKI